RVRAGVGAVDDEAHVVPLRAGQGNAPAQLVPLQPLQRGAKQSRHRAGILPGGIGLLLLVPGEEGLVHQLQPLAAFGHGAVHPPGRLRQAVDGPGPGHHDGHRFLQQLLVPDFQQLASPASPLQRLQLHVAMAQDAVIANQMPRVFRVGLAQQHVQKAPALRGSAFHQIQIIGEKADGSQKAQRVPRPQRAVVPRNALGRVDGDDDLQLAGAVPLFHQRRGGRDPAAPPHQLAVAPGAGRLAEAEEQHALQQVRFALGVAPQKHVDRGRRLQVDVAVVAEVVQNEALDDGLRRRHPRRTGMMMQKRSSPSTGLNVAGTSRSSKVMRSWSSSYARSTSRMKRAWYELAPSWPSWTTSSSSWDWPTSASRAVSVSVPPRTSATTMAGPVRDRTDARSTAAASWARGTTMEMGCSRGSTWR